MIWFGSNAASRRSSMKPTTFRSPTRPAGRRPRGEALILVAADWAPIRAFEPLLAADPEAVYGTMLPVLRAADLRIVNCECALTAAATPVWKSGAVFKGEPRHVGAVTAVPFEVACLANNHVLDYGVAGLRETLRVLRRNGVLPTGAGLSEEEACAPLTLDVNGATIHIVNFSEGEDLTAAHGGPGVFGWDVPRMISLVRGLKRAGGVVIAIGHCGLEYVPYPPPYVAAAFRAIAEAGADCVIGHHPHVPQGIEWHGGRPIVYSLGNFVFYQATELLHRKTGFCVGVHVEGRRVSGIDLHPYRITGSGLRALAGADDVAFRRTLARISKPLDTTARTERAWHAYLAYYGMAGFIAEVQGIVDRLATEPQKAAAMFRNRITTMQHVELWRDFLTRVVAGDKVPYSREAYATVTEWFTRKIEGQEGS